MKCDRCGVSKGVFVLSWFNLDNLCLDCREDETHAPNYPQARQAELEHAQAGVKALQEGAGEEAWKPLLNFTGIGLAPEDEAFLAARLASRRAQQPAAV